MMRSSPYRSHARAHDAILPAAPPAFLTFRSARGGAAPSGRVILVAIAAILQAAIARAQLTSDQLPRDRIIPTEEQVRLDLERSRFRLGPIRLLPSLELSQAGYDNNVFGTADEEPIEPVSDWSATISAGLRGVLPVGSKVYVRADVLPAYIWYRELTGRRTLGGSYGASLFGFFNRMSLEVRGHADQSIGALNSEVETRVVRRQYDGGVNVEVDLTRALSAFVGGDAQRLQFRLGGEAPVLLIDVEEFDRTEGLARAGLRYRFSESASVSVGAEATRTEFDNVPLRNNETRAYLLGIHFARPRFYLALAGAYREGRPYGSSAFPEYSTPSGSYFLSYYVNRALEFRVYGNRRVAYGGDPGTPYYIDTRNGAGINVQVRPRLLLRGFGEFGENDYDLLVPVGDRLVKRKDPVTTYGGGFSLLLYRDLVLTAVASEIHHTSNVPGLERTIFRFTTSLSLRGEFTR